MTDNSWWASCRFSTKPCQGQACWGAGAASLEVCFWFLLVSTLSATMEEKSILRSIPSRFSLLTSLLKVRGSEHFCHNSERQKERRDSHGGNCSLPISSMAFKRLIGSLSRSIATLFLLLSSIASNSRSRTSIRPSDANLRLLSSRNRARESSRALGV